MADSRVSNAATSFPLPPGAFFHPSEELLLSYYLTSKNSLIPRYATDFIKEIDLYNYDPFGLPKTACFRFGEEGRRKHWYCYVRREEVERPLRAAGNGYWKRIGEESNVIGGGVERVVVGTRKAFVFYLMKGNSTAAPKTEWLMHEYELIGHPKGSFVLCRVFVKWDGESTPSCQNSVVPAELHLGVQHENVSRVHHCGCQHGGAAVAGEGNEDDVIDDLYNLPFGQDSELEHQNISNNPVADQEMRPFNDAAAMDIDGLITQQVEDIFKLDDFLQKRATKAQE